MEHVIIISKLFSSLDLSSIMVIDIKLTFGHESNASKYTFQLVGHSQMLYLRHKYEFQL